eukprot:tig00000317_g24024.t1
MGAGKALVVLYPLCFAGVCWLVCLRTDDVLSRLALPLHAAVRLKDVLPPLPETRAVAFEVGRIVERLKIAQALPDVVKIEAALVEAQRALGVTRPIKAEYLLDLGQRIAEADAGRGLAQRVLGFFTFVNVIWMFSILGISISVGPAVLVLIGPVLKRIVISFLVPFWRNCVLPVLIALRPLYELVAYLTCARIYVEGARYPPETGLFISLTAVMLLVPSVTFSAYLHSTGGGRARDLSNLINFFVALSLAPGALQFDSRLLGFLAVLAFYAVLGFSVVPVGLCWYVGWGSQDAMSRTAATSLVLLLGAAAARFGVGALAPAASALFRPFASGIQCMGTIALYLALLIMASPGMRGFKYWRANGAMIVCLLAGLFVGSVFAYPAVFNVACTFSVLFVSEKVLELPVWRSAGGVWLLLLAGSASLYYLALWLHSHPGFVASLFDV